LRASIRLAQRDWSAALADAEAALALNPEHVQSANLRAMALVRLGRKSEAAATVNYALERAPENAFSHANQGWTCLHQNDPRKAQEHFREALRLDPEMEFARQGMLEALKARNPIYRGMLAYYLWIGRKSGRGQWAFVIGTIIVLNLVRGSARILGGAFWVLVVAFYLFIYLSWTARPMFNLLLRLDRFGRCVLSHDERVATNWFGGVLAAALGSACWWAWSGQEMALGFAVIFVMVSICVSATFNRLGRNRKVLAACSVALGVLGLGGMAIAYSFDTAALLVAFVIGFIGFQFLANMLRG
jgi:tetratricopeptide (TPR) repeat protein